MERKLFYQVILNNSKASIAEFDGALESIKHLMKNLPASESIHILAIEMTEQEVIAFRKSESW